MNPKVYFIIELCKLIGRLSHAVESNDNHAFLGILRLMRALIDISAAAHTPRLPFRVIDNTILDDVDDDEL